MQKIITAYYKTSDSEMISETTGLVPKRIHDAGQYKGATAYYKTSEMISETAGLVPKRVHDAGQYKGAAETNQSPDTHALLFYNCKILVFLYFNLIRII